jgi:hypothetical protein
MLLDERIDAKTRQGWSKRFTDAVRTLSHVLNDREINELDKRLKEVKEYRKKLAGKSDPEPSSTEPNNQSGQQGSA